MSNIKQDLRVGESVSFDDGRVVITLLEKSGQRARFDIKAADDVKVNVNKAASISSVAQKGLKLPIAA
jgi:pyruvate kinase